MTGDDPATIAARAGVGQPGADGADLVAPLRTTAVRLYADIGSLDEAMTGRDVYRRYGGGNPALLEGVLADLETPADGVRPLARATSSGQAALLLALTLVASPSRRRIVIVRPCYATTETLVAGPLGNLGLELTTVDVTDGTKAGAIVGEVLDADVAAVVTEAVTNPLIDVIDVPAIASRCRAAGAACIVDSTFPTPFLFQPFAHGADLVFHSLTKHLGGHSDVLGGVLLVAPDHPAADWLDVSARCVGAGLAPFDAWLALRGLRTAALRIERAAANATALAAFLVTRPEVAAVYHPTLRDGAARELADRLMPRGTGPMLGFDLSGGRPAVERFVTQLHGVRLAPSLGDVATTVSYPALTSHRSMSPEQRRALGIGDGLVRVSAGIEDIDDLIREFGTALAATRGGRSATGEAVR